jgi:glycosyltransferase involved in cell wall biosynthesis
MKQPLITVITVVRNRVKTIEQAMLSVLNQNYPNIEYIVLDGGSTDGTVEIIKKYADRISYWESGSDGGMYFALNKGILMAKGELIGVCHSDDFLHRSDVVSRIAAIHAKEDADIYHGDGIMFLEYPNYCGFTIKKSQAEMITKTENSILHPSTFINRTVFERFGLYDTEYRSASDYELMIRFAINQVRFFHVGFVVCCIRIDRKGRVSNNIYSYIEAYKFHKNHKTGNHNKYLFGFLECLMRRVARNILSRYDRKNSSLK